MILLKKMIVGIIFFFFYMKRYLQWLSVEINQATITFITVIIFRQNNLANIPIN
jgi:hypothetical protein